MILTIIISTSTYAARCLHNVPDVEDPIKLILPGKLQTLDQQCQKYHKTRACYVSLSIIVIKQLRPFFINKMY